MDCHLTRDTLKKTSACETNGVVRTVTADLCGQCHGEQLQEFAASKHAKAWIVMDAMPTTKDQPSAIMAGMKGCGGCHRVGFDSGRCDSCHTRHLFSAAEHHEHQEPLDKPFHGCILSFAPGGAAACHRHTPRRGESSLDTDAMPVF